MKRVLLFPEYGRLGNQLFQLSGLQSSIGVDERVVLIGFDSFKTGFGAPRHHSVHVLTPPNRFLRRFLGQVLRRISRWPSSIDLVGRDSTASHDVPGACLVSVVRPAFFQQQRFLETEFGEDLRFQPAVVHEADRVLESLGLSTRPFGFIHVRGGDYAHWPSMTAPASLPIEWTIDQGKALLAIYPQLDLLVFGDDAKKSQQVADALQSPHVRVSESVDICLLSRAQCGVLSGSTYALWGANLARRHNMAPGPWIAPKYWAGVRLRKWYPPDLVVSWLTYTSVESYLEPE